MVQLTFTRHCRRISTTRCDNDIELALLCDMACLAVWGHATKSRTAGLSCPGVVQQSMQARGELLPVWQGAQDFRFLKDFRFFKGVNAQI